MIDIRKENNKKCIVYVDGASSGNPGKAGIGVVIYLEREKVKEISECIGIKTNNQAEYSAMIRALEELKKLKIYSAIIKSDSKLVISQIRGEYKVRAKNVVPLYNKVLELTKGMNLKFEWVRREENREADELAKRGSEKCSQKNTSQRK